MKTCQDCRGVAAEIDAMLVDAEDGTEGVHVVNVADVKAILLQLRTFVHATDDHVDLMAHMSDLRAAESVPAPESSV